ncbi:glutathione S-transferase omega-like 2 [Conidiobolus coronatus NRRL 28638]|uniref:Glutathione S-transferase omega-like 2 n=1 Tax=Conidiobolus coronatus (strain ATCC 28846 / CBS 209.66 / NRRL 28638) TaxID=796925 RepID=A0A137PI73_CONC2|nr:glutathione S-transferase omega-like 2 [Conidiobolus coronatus NRRL 28638]|eukprot:KXN74670.1 glutathione S-transferase omega-like 2 [Conidiobolus coronatus NRRL 28638]
MSTNILQWASKDGEFKRQVSSFRDFVSTEADAKFQPESNRYHLYISLACPWAHRTLIVLKLKRLDKHINVSVVDYLMQDKGWKFSTAEETPGSIPDTVNNAQYIREVYFKAEPEYNARFTVPVLWDKKLNTIVNNESSEIIRMFNNAFDSILPKEVQGVDFYPQELRSEIDQINEWIYNDINNGVYKSGFATTQEAYENNVYPLFKSLDRVEDILSKNKYLVGGKLTEADIRLWTTIVRFDPVYHGHFKCNLKSITHDYPHILNWARRIYQLPNIAETVNMEHIKKHYYMSHKQINPTQVVPISNGPDLTAPVRD